MKADPKQRTRTITWEDPMTVPGAAAGKTGLELLTEISEGRLPPPPITKTMNFQSVEFSEGKAVFVGEPDESLHNPIGVVHGAFAMALLDSALGCAVHTTLAADEAYTTVETKVNFVRPITLQTGSVRCEASLVHRGGRIAIAEGKLVAESDGKLLAHGTSTCLVIKRP